MSWEKKSITTDPANKVTLDKIGESAGSLTFNGTAVGGGTTTTSAVRFKKWSAIGDSITFAQGLTAYHAVASTILGIPTVVNMGINGSTLANNAQGMVTRYTSVSADTDLITVAGGTNDWGLNVPLGTITDTVNTTFYGALNIMCDGFYTNYKGVAVAFFTPLHRQNESSGGSLVANTNGNLLTDFRDAIITVCNKFSIPVFDLNRMGGFYPVNSTFNTNYTIDGLHPNNAGHQLIGNKVAGFLRNL